MSNDIIQRLKSQIDYCTCKSTTFPIDHQLKIDHRDNTY